MNIVKKIKAIIFKDAELKLKIKENWTDEEENRFWRDEATKTCGPNYSVKQFRNALLRYRRDCAEKEIEFHDIGR